MKRAWVIFKISAVVLGILLCLVFSAIGWVFYHMPGPYWRAQSLIAAVGDKTLWPRGRWYAAAALEAKGTGPMISVLPSLMTTEESVLQDIIPEYMIHLGPAAVPALLQNLSSSDAHDRQAAAFWLGARAWMPPCPAIKRCKLCAKRSKIPTRTCAWKRPERLRTSLSRFDTI